MAQIVQKSNAITCSYIITLCNVTNHTKTCNSRRSCQCRDTDSEPVKDGILSVLFAARFCERSALHYGFCCYDTCVQYTEQLTWCFCGTFFWILHFVCSLLAYLIWTGRWVLRHATDCMLAFRTLPHRPSSSSFGATVPSPKWAMACSFARFLDHTQRRTTVGRTSLDEWSARRRDLHLTKHNTHNRQTSIPLL
jgi:hypothetical protein